MHERVNSGVIFAVVLINAIIGFLQEAKAANAIECLSRIVTMQTTVRRGRQKERVASERLVPGDIVQFPRQPQAFGIAGGFGEQ